MNVGEYIRQLRINKGITQEELGKIIGVQRAAVQKWECNKTQNLKRTTIQKLATYFDVSPSSFIFEDTSIDKTLEFKISSDSAIKIPVLGRVAAGIPIDAVEEILDYEEVSPEMAKRGNLIGLQIKGHSMEPRICDGDVVIIKCQNYIDDNRIGIVIINGGEATCKKIKFSEAGITLLSFNPAYEPIFYSNAEIENLPVRIFGEVIELRGKFKK